MTHAGLSTTTSLRIPCLNIKIVDGESAEADTDLELIAVSIFGNFLPILSLLRPQILIRF